MTIKHIGILIDSDCIEILRIVTSRKHRTIKYHEQEILERIFVDSYFEAHPEIDQTKWSSWSIANSLKDLLNDQLESLGIIKLPQPHPDNPHDFVSNKKGIAKILAIENKVKLQKKLQAKQVK
jgi:hypothetical protein